MNNAQAKAHSRSGIKVHQLALIVGDLKGNQLLVEGAAGMHLSDLVALAGETKEQMA
jgi:hypothetical protein